MAGIAGCVEPKAKGAHRGVWRRRYWEHLIRDDEDFSAHVAYIHWNPVKHGPVKNPDDWPYSSWHRHKRDYGRPHTTPPEEWKPPHSGERR